MRDQPEIGLAHFSPLAAGGETGGGDLEKRIKKIAGSRDPDRPLKNHFDTSRRKRL